MTLEDVHNNSDHPRIPIDQVGVTDLRYPIVILDRINEKQTTVAKLTLSVGLPHHFKGTHMSRFIEIINKHKGEMTMNTFPLVLTEMRKRFDAETARIEVSFPYFINRSAPETGTEALVDYDCTFIGEVNGSNSDFLLEVKVPVTSLCPCSKAISDYGAHNQRGFITIRVRTKRKESGEMEFIWIEELIDIAEESASGPVYALLKRPDERFVTMQAYDNPVFVEDMVRNVASKLKEDSRITWFWVKAENQESIHNHNAFAEIEWKK
ncbi:GTP cyclohydrolase FolE2 [Candidatus Riflebacteria bacterium]